MHRIRPCLRAHSHSSHLSRPNSPPAPPTPPTPRTMGPHAFASPSLLSHHITTAPTRTHLLRPKSIRGGHHGDYRDGIVDISPQGSASTSRSTPALPSPARRTPVVATMTQNTNTTNTTNSTATATRASRPFTYDAALVALGAAISAGLTFQSLSFPSSTGTAPTTSPWLPTGPSFPAGWEQAPSPSSDRPKGESVEWVNMATRKMWRVYQRGLESWFQRLLQGVFDMVTKRFTPTWLRRMRIAEFTLDYEPPLFQVRET